MAQFVSLLQNYRCLYWLCCRPTLPASPSSLYVYMYVCLVILHLLILQGSEYKNTYIYSMLLCVVSCIYVRMYSESNLRQLAALNISTSSRGPPSTTGECSHHHTVYIFQLALYCTMYICTYVDIRISLCPIEGSVLELYLRSVGGSQLRSALLRTGQLSSGVHLCSLWTSLLPESINILIAQLYPLCVCVCGGGGGGDMY